MLDANVLYPARLRDLLIRLVASYAIFATLAAIATFLR